MLLPARDAGKSRIEAVLRGGFSSRGAAVRVKIDGRKYDLKYELN